MDGTWFWIAAVVAAMLVGMGKGGLPVVGMLGVPVLSLVMSPVAAAGLLLPVYIVSDVFGLYAYRHAFDRRVVAILAAGGTLGVGLGWATASVVPEDVVTLLVGLIGLVFALNLLIRRSVAAAKEARLGPGLFWGMLTGFTSFVSHAGAPPYQVYVQPLGLGKAVFAGTTTVLFAYINAIKLVPYFALGQINAGSLKAAAVLAVPAAIAVYAGVKLVKILPEALFFRLVTWALLLISIKLIRDGVMGLL
jgi:uncharacterized membrane protein YfcA